MDAEEQLLQTYRTELVRLANSAAMLIAENERLRTQIECDQRDPEHQNCRNGEQQLEAQLAVERKDNERLRKQIAEDAVGHVNVRDAKNRMIEALAAERQAREAAERKLRFYDEIETDESKGWCGEHPRRFAVNAREGDEGTYDECQVCRAETAERALAEIITEGDALNEWTNHGPGCEAPLNTPSQCPCGLRQARANWERVTAGARGER